MAREILIKVIRAQLEAAAQPNHPRHDAIISIQKQGETYLSDLATLLKQLEASSHLDERKGINLHEPSLAWKIPAFSGPYPYLVNHKHLLAICHQMSPVSIFMKEKENDIWCSSKLLDWMNSAASSLLLIHGTHDATDALHAFGAQLATAVSKQARPVVYMAGGVWGSSTQPEKERERGVIPLDTSQILRHMAIQILQLISAINYEDAGKLLASEIEKISEATSERDWLAILGSLTLKLNNLDIIIDVGSLFDETYGISSWPKVLEGFINKVKELSGPPHSLRIALISPYPMAGASSQVPVISVEGPELIPSKLPNNSKLSFPTLPSVQLSTTTTMTTTTPTPASVSARFDTPSASSSRYTESYAADAAGPGQYRETSGRGVFSVAIFCARSADSEAVGALFATHRSVEEYGRTPGDTNTYTAGRIGNLSVVLVHLTTVGKVSAARAATNCHNTFPNIRLSLVVGTCGGVPSSRNERALGDVIISDALVQYDFGRRFPGEFVRKNTPQDNLGRQSPEIRSFIAKLKNQRTLKELHASTWHRLDALQKDESFGEMATYPGAHADVLYESSYVHKHRGPATCQDWQLYCGTSQGVCDLARSSRCEDLPCEEARRVSRSTQAPPIAIAGASTNTPAARLGPRIYFGAVGSGDRLMRSGRDRDSIAKDEGVIAFEMEGAGIWDVFPCLVIKGIANYADSHDTRHWDNYAALSAAACAVSLLERWSSDSGR